MPQSSEKYIPALGFHWLTPFYDAVVGATTREGAFKQTLVNQAGVAPGQQILDLACGTGTLAIWIKQYQPQANITGVDGDPAILALASRKAQKADSPFGLTVHYPITCHTLRRTLIESFRACSFTTYRGKTSCEQRERCSGFSSLAQSCMWLIGDVPPMR